MVNRTCALLNASRKQTTMGDQQVPSDTAPLPDVFTLENKSKTERVRDANAPTGTIRDDPFRTREHQIKAQTRKERPDQKPLQSKKKTGIQERR